MYHDIHIHTYLHTHRYVHTCIDCMHQHIQLPTMLPGLVYVVAGPVQQILFAAPGQMPLPVMLYNEASAPTTLSTVLFFSHMGVATIGVTLIYQAPMLVFTIKVGPRMLEKLLIGLDDADDVSSTVKCCTKATNLIPYHLHLTVCVHRSVLSKIAHRARADS